MFKGDKNSKIKCIYIRNRKIKASLQNETEN